MIWDKWMLYDDDGFYRDIRPDAPEDVKKAYYEHMKETRNIKNNDFLLGLDMSKATQEQKIQWLCQMIDNETDKPEDEMDFALIDECSDYLRELSNPEAKATPEQKQRILQEIKARHQG